MRKAKWIVAVIAVVALVVLLRYTVFAPEIVEVRTAAVERGWSRRPSPTPGPERSRSASEPSSRPRSEAWWWPCRIARATGLRPADLWSSSTAVPSAPSSRRRGPRSRRRRLRPTRPVSPPSWPRRSSSRVETLHAQGIASDQNLDLLQYRPRPDPGRLRGGAGPRSGRPSRGSLRLEVQLEFTELRAPFAGTVAEVSTEVGEYITPSPPGLPIPPVIDLLDPASIYVSAPIDEVDAERVKVGQAVRVTVDSRPDRTFEGSVARVAPYVLDVLEQNRTVEVEVELADPAAMVGVLPGTSADVELILDRRDDTLRIPASAVAEGGKVLVLVRRRSGRKGTSRSASATGASPRCWTDSPRARRWSSSATRPISSRERKPRSAQP